MTMDRIRTDKKDDGSTEYSIAGKRSDGLEFVVGIRKYDTHYDIMFYRPIKYGEELIPTARQVISDCQQYQRTRIRVSKEAKDALLTLMIAIQDEDWETE